MSNREIRETHERKRRSPHRFTLHEPRTTLLQGSGGSGKLVCRWSSRTTENATHMDARRDAEAPRDTQLNSFLSQRPCVSARGMTLLGFDSELPAPAERNEKRRKKGSRSDWLQMRRSVDAYMRKCVQKDAGQAVACPQTLQRLYAPTHQPGVPPATLHASRGPLHVLFSLPASPAPAIILAGRHLGRTFDERIGARDGLHGCDELEGNWMTAGLGEPRVGSMQGEGMMGDCPQ